MIKKLILKIFLLTFLVNVLQAQSSVNSGGGDGNNSGSSISYTVGQIDFFPIANSNTTFTPGIQQAYSIITSSSYGVANQIISVFPNPANNHFQINLNNISQSNYTLYSIDGSTVLKGFLHHQNSNVDISYLDAGIYYLKINNTSIKVIKI